MNKKLLSICIPTWNRAELLEKLLKELTSQIISSGFQDRIELIISNNGSIDNTEEIVLNYKEKYNFIIYNNNNVNKGGRYNLFKSYELATGKYLVFLGDDDRYKNDACKKIINCLESHPGTGAVFDSSLFKNNPFGNKAFISLEQLLLNFYYNIGNAGLFMLRTEPVQKNIIKFGYEYFSTSWPQTQLIVLGLYQNPGESILIESLDLFAKSNHDEVMMYNSYYLLRGLYFDLADAILSIKNEISTECYQAARKYLKNNLTQTTFNILQCGVFVDDASQRKKTISYIKNNLAKYSVSEKAYLYIIIIALFLPVKISKTLSNIFIFMIRGKAGMEKKNTFVKQEMKKIQNKVENNKSVRTFDFNL